MLSHNYFFSVLTPTHHMRDVALEALLRIACPPITISQRDSTKIQFKVAHLREEKREIGSLIKLRKESIANYNLGEH